MYKLKILANVLKIKYKSKQFKIKDLKTINSNHFLLFRYETLVI